MSLPPDLLRFRLAAHGDEITFNGDPDANGVEYLGARLDGWESPDVRVDTNSRLLEHGLDTGPFLYDGRPMTLTGSLHSPSGITHLREARDRLLAICDTPRGFATLSVDEVPARAVAVKRSGRVGITMTGKNALLFDIPLLAPDPRRYAQAETVVTPITTGAGTAVTPGGTFSDGTPAIITLSSAAQLSETTTGSLFVVVGGRAVQWDTGRGLIVHTDDGSLAYDSIDQTGSFGLMLKPGVTYHFKRTGGTSGTVRYRDAWV